MKRRSYAQYMGKTIARVLPMVWACGIVYAILGGIYYEYFGVWYRNCEVNFWSVIASFLLVFAGGAVGNIGIGINNPTWYLCVLLICYSFLWIIDYAERKLGVATTYGYVFILFVGLAVRTYNIQLPVLNQLSGRGYIAFFIGCLLVELKNILSHKAIYYSSIVLIGIWLGAWILRVDFLFGAKEFSICFTLYPAIVLLGSMKKIAFAQRMDSLLRYSFYLYMWHGCFLLVQGMLYALGKIQYNNTTMILFLITTFILSGVFGMIVDTIGKCITPKIEEFIVLLFSK